MTGQHITEADATKLQNSDNPAYARRDLHDHPYGHGKGTCPFGFEHLPDPTDEEVWADLSDRYGPGWDDSTDLRQRF